MKQILTLTIGLLATLAYAQQPIISYIAGETVMLSIEHRGDDLFHPEKPGKGRVILREQDNILDWYDFKIESTWTHNGVDQYSHQFGNIGIIPVDAVAYKLKFAYKRPSSTSSMIVYIDPSLRYIWAVYNAKNGPFRIIKSKILDVVQE